MKKYLEKVSFLSLPLYFLCLVCLDYAFRLFYRFLSNTALLSTKPMAFTFGWALLLCGLLALLPPLARKIAMGAVGGFFALLAVVHGVMYNIFGHFFTFADMNFAGDGARFFSWTYFALRKAFLLCVLLFLCGVVLAILLVKRPEPGKKQWKLRAAALALAAVSLLPIGLMHRALTPKEDAMWWGNTFDPNADTEIYRSFTDSNKSLLLTGLYQYTARNLAVTLGWGEDRLGAAELDRFYGERAENVSPDNEMTGALKGKNFLMVMLESADTWLLTPEYMPNLSALREKSVDFSRFYTPLFLSAGTFNTEIISQTGLIPAASGLSSAAYSTNSFPLSLAHLFQKEGYTVNSFHSASPAIYSRGSIHRNLGFEDYHNYVDMGMDDYQLDSQMVRAYDQMAPEGSFFTYVITYSGHGPYTDELKNISDPHLEEAKAAVARSGVSGTEENMSEYTLAVAHAMETDQFVGGLLEKLAADGKLKDTVLLFYADHYGKYMTDKEFLKSLKGVAGDPHELYWTPCFLYSADLPAGTVDKYCASVDLVPTLVNLFGLPAERRYYVGDDIFGDRGGFVMMPDGSWFGEAQGDPEEMPLEVKRRISASMDTLKCDYFKFF